MPRGQKSKIRARVKRRQTLEELLEDLELQGAAAMDTTDEEDSDQTPETDTNFQEDPSIWQSPPITAIIIGPIDEKVIMMVHYLLYKYRMKEPIKKGDMLRNVIQTYRCHFHEIVRRAAEYLELIFGLDLKELEPNKHVYVLVNKLQLGHDVSPSDDTGMPKTGLLMIILGVIFIRGNCATEEEMWQTLNVMGLYDGREHFIYGEPRKLITQDLVQENYLEYRQVAYSDPPRYEFLWGPRAYAETNKMKVLEFLAKVHNTIPSAFPRWYEEALKDEEERAQARAEARARHAARADARAKAKGSSSSHSSNDV